MIFDNFRLVTGPEAEASLHAWRLNNPAPLPAPIREPLPNAIIEHIKRLAEEGRAPGAISHLCSTNRVPVTKNAVIRVLAGGLG